MGADDRTRTLDELEGMGLGQARYGGSPAERRVLELRGVPIGQYSPEDIRLAIEGDSGLAHLIPLALEILSANPLVRAGLYAGDLLDAVQRVGHGYWLTHPAQRQAIEKIAARVATSFDD